MYSKIKLMINLHNIQKSIVKSLLWLVITNYGRFILGIILCLMGVFSSNSTIEFLRTDYLIFDILLAAGCLIIGCQFAWVVIMAIYLYATNGWD